MLPDIVVLRMSRKEAGILMERLEAATNKRHAAGVLSTPAIDLLPVAEKLRAALKPPPSNLELEEAGQATLPLPAA